MMNQTQGETLHKFRQEMVQESLLHEGDTIGTDDETLLRFLKARNFDLAQSKRMFANCQQWRKTCQGVGIDKLYAEIDPFDYPERDAVFECWPMWFHKIDKVIGKKDCQNVCLKTQQKGRPINIQTLGRVDLASLYKVCTPERHWETILVSAECLPREVLPAATRAAGRHIGNTLGIVDLKGFGLSHFWQVKAIAKNSFQISQDYYPETMGQLVIINAPSTFAIIWNVIKSWLPKETVAKIDILGSDYKRVLLELVDAEALPASLGGQCTCEGLGGCELSGAGPWQDGRKGWGPQSQAARETSEDGALTTGLPAA